MPVNRKSSYRETFISYYGKRVPANFKPKSMNAKKASVIITRAFDAGDIIANPSDTDYIEYDIVSRNNDHSVVPQSQSNDNYIEYDIFANDTPVTSIDHVSGLSGGDDVYIEPFNNSERQPRVDSHQPCHCECHDKQQAPQSPGHQQQQQPAPPQQHAVAADVNAWQEDSEEGKKVSETDKDFLADIQSILKGQKVYDKSTRKLSDAQSETGTSAENKSPSDESYHGLKNQTPGFKESEHAIFDRIAQSMRYANAYDLGSIPLEKRFEDFDHMDELSKGQKQTPSYNAKQNSATKTIYQQPDIQLSNTDFIHDLDYIKQRNATVTAVEAFTGETSIDSATGGNMITTDALQPCDIILSITNQPVSVTGTAPSTDANTSHAAIYTGNGNLIELSGNNAVEVSVVRALADDTIAVAYRHSQMTPDVARRMLTYLRSMIGRSYNHFALLKINPAAILNVYCKKFSGPVQEDCRNAVVHFRPGTDRNDEFYCSELILQALQEAELSITQSLPAWTPTENVVRLMHNGTLLYIGHLKA